MNDLCPNCRKITDLIEKIIEIDSDDEKNMKIVKNYYCSICNLFVKSEEF